MQVSNSLLAANDKWHDKYSTGTNGGDLIPQEVWDSYQSYYEAADDVKPAKDLYDQSANDYNSYNDAYNSWKRANNKANALEFLGPLFAESAANARNKANMERNNLYSASVDFKSYNSIIECLYF